jgi:hypothetical protein
MTSLLDSVAAAVAALSGVPRDVTAHRALPDAELLELTRALAAAQRLCDAHVAVAAAEIARRSAPELGYDGLAQRSGARTAVELVRVTTGSTARQAAAAIRAGQLAHDAATPADPASGELPPGPRPWLHSVGLALGSELSVASADAIRNGLGEPSGGVDETALGRAAAALCEEATVLDADRLYRRARELRDELDAEGIADREAARREKRGLRFRRLPDGMARITWDLDPESAASVGDLYDRATSPRRGGPRFVDGRASEVAQRILDDERTTEQLASDVFVELLTFGADADSSRLLGSGAPVITVLVTATDAAARHGHGRIEGQPDPVSIATVERLACGGTVVPVVFDATDVLNLGRSQRLYSNRQRMALAARDGGCRIPGCDRPPSWTEAHHIEHWERDGGPTDLANGILLCRHHHLLVHNNAWEIRRTDGAYWLVPPPDVDPSQRPIAIPSKSAGVADLIRERVG